MKFAKNDSFVDEDEIRLHYDSLSVKYILHPINLLKTETEEELFKNAKNNILDLVKNLGLNEEQFCMSKRGIRSYRDLNLEEVWGSGTIPEIILGPLCVKNRKELCHFFES